MSKYKREKIYRISEEKLNKEYKKELQSIHLRRKLFILSMTNDFFNIPPT
jgi:hypothetical protein